MTTELIAASKNKLWLAAIKPTMYSVAIMPIWVGTAVAVFETSTINWKIFTTFITAAILILAWENILNDVFDSETGIDKNKHHSLVNLTENKSLVIAMGNSCLALAILGLLGICWWQQDLTVLGLILLCCGLGYLYQGPPFRLGYQGLGEFLCFFAFGPLGVSAAYYSQTQNWSWVCLATSIIVAIPITLVLFCSHFHQVEDDINAGKKSPIVRLGTERGAKLLPWFCGSIFILTGGFVLWGIFPIWTLLSFVAIPSGIKLCRHVSQYHNQPNLVSNCKFIAIALQFWSGLFLGIGLILG
ncbi:2-carboxy-1,4-naphthoquinone phytyltransferase [Planktothrix agardhii]|uniref:2-carboxy-1,4-naphthoquinone phytyltransferase n=1 Tax=Planktothrix agardhii TaxID=1160 RepID=UPI001B967619|nr:2-carboxy-1,4-naphthoquinone phytyltransferase [Planktothrix agardhii]MCB8776133.1 2-carboxy-1,4-naphthoquinone phytyltransferase [Planktothrix agardhii 1031]MCB8784892.1 2-carboxy-1,4-naphthoquinone phytyltransferase [Planktothrix agardhii 1025]MCF3600358.1 2-carboxy-1,4-naphthoquinone phytyltransferase [Planktothrix agardhii 1032]MCF3611055.1 2-carboxy-1,4-naphthoquinone phytyltransferase [Planktothrix agardhii 1027]MCF3644708.1 2-carboxy-1,4-naphthoquinone phytyltransferase [Planktothrix